MSDLREKREIAQSEARDLTGKIIAGTLGLGPAYDLITTLVVPLHKKKQKEFVQDLATRLKKLEDQGHINFEKLAQNEEFNTIITKAILLAQQNHQKEKIEALKGIVINSSLELSQDKEMFDWTDHFLNVIERISPFHILLLKTFQSPDDIVREKGIDLGSEFNSLQSKDVFFDIYPEYRDRAKLITQCWKELYELGFVAFESFEDGRHMPGKLNKLTTDFGDKFLNMISSDELTTD